MSKTSNETDMLLRKIELTPYCESSFNLYLNAITKISTQKLDHEETQQALKLILLMAMTYAENPRSSL
jgi:hypothetical protein